MQTTPRLILNCDYFIIVNNNVLNLLDNNLISWIAWYCNAFVFVIFLMLVRCVFHLEEIEWHFHALEINDKLIEFQKPKYGNILQKLLFLLSSQTSNTHHVYNRILTFLSKQVLVLNMLDFYGHDILPHNT